MTELENVGYIGLGSIGKPSALRLLQGPWQTHVFDLDTRVVDELVAAGAVGHESIESLAAQAGHIGICVRDDEQVEQVLYGPGGIFEAAAPGTLIAVHSTVGLAALERWAEDASRQGLALIDAAISGGASGAAAGTLCYMVGAGELELARARAVFETSAGRIVHAGTLGSGMLLKLCNNLITYAEFMAMSEACRLATAGGLSIDVLREVGLSNGVVNESMYQFVKNREALTLSCSEPEMLAAFGPYGRLAEKDLDCALACARDLGVELPSVARLREEVFALFMNQNQETCGDEA